MSANPILQELIANINTKQLALKNLYEQSLRLLYTNLAPDNFYNAWINTISVDYTLFPEIFKYFRLFNQNEVTLVLENFAESVQEFIDYIALKNVQIAYQDKILSAKKAMDNLNRVAKLLLQQDLDLAYTYEVPHTMSIRSVLFKNKKDFNDQAEIDLFLKLNAAKVQTVNRKKKGTKVTLFKNEVSV